MSEVASDTVPAFLQRLGLDGDADARAIRRAYAREVKLIDQEHEAARFQDLRDAYEVALQWAAHQDWVRQQEQAPAAPQPDPETGRADPARMADAAFDELLAGRATLEQLLDDEQLINVTARTMFEARVAHLLAGGWQSGHEALLSAACEVFRWKAERSRLLQFGRAGAVVNRAIEEWAAFDAHEHSDALRSIVRRVLAAYPPTLPELFERDNEGLDFLLANFPNYMGLTVDPAKIETWQSRLNAIRENQRAHADAVLAAEPAKSGISGGMGFMLVLALMALIRGISSMSSGAPADYGRPARTQLQDPVKFEQPVIAPLLDQLEKPRPAPYRMVPVPGDRLSKAQLDEIGARIHFDPRKRTALGKLLVRYQVHLDQQGKVSRLDKTTRSGDILYDEAVATAIRDSKPFPANIARKFSVYYSSEIVAQPLQFKKAEKAEKAEKAQDSAPEPAAAQ